MAEAGVGSDTAGAVEVAEDLAMVEAPASALKAASEASKKESVAYSATSIPDSPP